MLNTEFVLLKTAEKHLANHYLQVDVQGQEVINYEEKHKDYLCVHDVAWHEVYTKKTN